MSISSVQNATALPSLPNAVGASATAPRESGFADLVASAIHETGKAQVNAERQVNAMLSGSGEDVHSAMLAVEQASLSFELILQVRNKVVNAYQEISRLQF